MASRTEQKRRLREEREAREASAAAADRRKRRVILLVASTVAALAVVGILIAVSQSGGGDESGLGGGESIAGVRDVAQRFRGIPQEGATLGDPNAPATMIEFVDLQCPFCAEYTAQLAPDRDRQVRPPRQDQHRAAADLRSSVRTRHGRGRRMAAAAQQQPDVAVRRPLLSQPGPGEPRLRDRRLPAAASARPSPGWTPQRGAAASKSPESVPLLRAGRREAQRAGINTTPVVPAARKGRPSSARGLELRAAPSSRPPLDEALAAR